MKIELWVTGKTNEKYLETGIAVFEKDSAITSLSASLKYRMRGNKRTAWHSDMRKDKKYWANCQMTIC